MGEGDAHGAQPLFAANRQVGDHGELFAAFGDVSLDLVARGPGRFGCDDRDRRVGFAQAARVADFGQSLAHGIAVVIGVEVEVGDAEQALLAAAGIEEAGRPEAGMRDDYLGVVSCINSDLV